MQFLGLISLFLVLFWFVSVRLGTQLLSPVFVLLAAYLVVFGIGGWVYNPYYGGSSIQIYLAPEEISELVKRTIVVLCSFLAGSLLFGRRRNPESIGVRIRQSQISDLGANLCMIFAFVVLLLLISANGWAETISRDGYMIEQSRSLKSVSEALLPVAVIALGAATSSRNSSIRLGSTVLVIVVAIVDLALSKRQLSLVPTLFFVGMYLTTTKKKRARAGLVLSLIVSPALLILPLTARGMTHQGVTSFPALIDELTILDWRVELRVVLNNVFVSAPITCVSVNTSVDNPLHYLVTSVNPLPGALTDWREIATGINSSTPFSTPGDLLRSGLPFAVAYYTLLGVYFGHLHTVLSSRNRRTLKHFVLAALSYLFVLTSLQYSLRASTRLVYYMMAFELALLALDDLLGKQAGKKRVGITVESKPLLTSPILSSNSFNAVD